MFATIASIGIPTGVSRFLAKSFNEKNLTLSRRFVKDSVVLISVGILGSVLLLFIINEWFYVTFDRTLLIFSMLLIGASTIAKLFNSIIVASLNTKIIPIVMLIVASTRTILVIALVLMNAGAVGVLTGYICFEVLSSILLAIVVLRMLRTVNNNKNDPKISRSFKSILNASIPFWIPKLITVLSGANLGTVIVFGSSGSAQAASYYLSYAISSAVFAIVLPLLTIAYPALAAMNDGRKRFTWRIIKISIIISLPLSSSIIFYSENVIGLLGHHYSDASLLLSLFLLAILPNSVSIMIGQLVYAYGNYRQVLYIGLASSIPTTILYALLVPLLGALGAVISYLTGCIISFVLSALVANKIGMKIIWKEIGLIVGISFLPAFVFSHVQVHYIIGIIATVLVSYIIFLKSQLITKLDVEDTLSVLPPPVSKPLKGMVHRIGTFLNRNY